MTEDGGLRICKDFPSSVRRGAVRQLADGGWSVRLKRLPNFGMNNYVVMSNYRIKNLPSLRNYRKKLRRNSTSAEAELWKLLKGKKLDGRKFRRQYSIGNYILDFYCVSDRLAIELDGDRHGDYVIINRDEEREIYLQKLGIRILRFENRMLFQEPEMVLKTIQSMLTEE